MPKPPDSPLPSLPESFRTVAVPKGAGFWRKMLAFAGPGYLVAVGYMDPGNWATDLAGGAAYGYSLLWIIGLSSCMAMLLQILSARLLLPQRDQQDGANDAGDGGPRHSEEDGIEIRHRHPRGWQRSAEDQHPDEAVDPAPCRLVHRPAPDRGWCPRTGRLRALKPGSRLFGGGMRRFARYGDSNDGMHR